MIPLLTTTSTVMCPHGGQATLITTDTDALVDGAPVLLQSDQHPIVGCPFVVAGVPTPCVVIRWLTAATQTKIRNVPVLHQTSVGLCFNAAQAPQGPAVVVQTQQRATGV
ncbi:MAG TPA: hypothetical protein VMK32_07380 [Burkholderiaceae bacterium]|nr:hypothetical protein [Burkholderiaceae bacterium]